MLDLKSQKVLMFDCQTSGTNPHKSHIIEAGWGIISASSSQEGDFWKSYLVALPKNAHISSRVRRVTGIASGDLIESDEGNSNPASSSLITYQELCERFLSVVQQNPSLPIVIHYAQFERSYIEKMCQSTSLVFSGEDLFSSISERIICTYQLSKRWFPHWNSYSLRAVSGALGHGVGEKKRVRDHLVASHVVWKHLAIEIDDAYDRLQPAGNRLSWLKSFKPKSDSLEHRKSSYSPHEHLRARRLSLPTAPGVYRFLDAGGQVLYVGKAKNLKNRVNSYFRGRKSKGSHLNEMLMRVNDFSVRPARSHLAAVIDESNLIKYHNPPYNRLLKSEFRQLTCVRLSHIDEAKTLASFPDRFLGPCSSSWIKHQLMPLLTFASAISRRSDCSIWGMDIPYELAEESYALLLDDYHLLPNKGLDLNLYELVGQIWERYRHILIQRSEESYLNRLITRSADEDLETKKKDCKSDDLEQFEGDSDGKQNINSFSLKEILDAQIRHAAFRIYRSRWLVRLMDCVVIFQDGDGQPEKMSLQIKEGDCKIFFSSEVKSKSIYDLCLGLSSGVNFYQRASTCDIERFDRLSIVYQEIKRAVLAGDSVEVGLREKLWLDSSKLRKLFL